ncbi:MAG: IS66 family insertion sequence element accessory protein TnpB [Deltaproteobacteria bacterium]|nr:IS66 family insertion sequence element accessory protein TnpB [Deltaproteobacteria bacterium]
MKGLDSFGRIYLHRDPVDMRKSINGLAMIVLDEMEMSFEKESLFVFLSRCGRKLKLLYWDRTGFALWYKRLEKERFQWPRDHDQSVLLSTSGDLIQLLQGFDVFQRPHAHLTYAGIG